MRTRLIAILASVALVAGCGSAQTETQVATAEPDAAASTTAPATAAGAAEPSCSEGQFYYDVDPDALPTGCYQTCEQGAEPSGCPDGTECIDVPESFRDDCAGGEGCSGAQIWLCVPAQS